MLCFLLNNWYLNENVPNSVLNLHILEFANLNGMSLILIENAAHSVNYIERRQSKALYSWLFTIFRGWKCHFHSVFIIVIQTKICDFDDKKVRFLKIVVVIFSTITEWITWFSLNLDSFCKWQCGPIVQY